MRKIIIKLGTIGMINALISTFIPPTFSLILRFVQNNPNVNNNDQIISALDIPETTTSGFNFASFLWVLVILGIIITFYVNFTVIKKVLSLVAQNLKFLYAIFPFCGWVVVVMLLLPTGLWRTYIVITTNDTGSLFGGSFITLGYIILLFLNGLIELIASVTAYCICKRRA